MIEKEAEKLLQKQNLPEFDDVHLLIWKLTNALKMKETGFIVTEDYKRAFSDIEYVNLKENIKKINQCLWVLFSGRWDYYTVDGNITSTTKSELDTIKKLLKNI